MKKSNKTIETQFSKSLDEALQDYNNYFNDSTDECCFVHVDETENLYNCLKSLISFRQRFFICNFCKVMGYCMKETKHHMKECVIRQSKVLTKQNPKTTKEKELLLKNAFTELKSFDDENQCYILWRFNNKQSCSSNASWDPCPESKKTKAVDLDNISCKTETPFGLNSKVELKTNNPKTKKSKPVKLSRTRKHYSRPISESTYRQIITDLLEWGTYSIIDNNRAEGKARKSSRDIAKESLCELKRKYRNYDDISHKFKHYMDKIKQMPVDPNSQKQL